MQSFDYTIKDALGIHARPAGQLAKEAKKYSSKCTLSCNGKTVAADKLMMIMSLGVKKDMTVTISCEGDDEETAIAGLKSFMEENL